MGGAGGMAVRVVADEHQAFPMNETTRISTASARRRRSLCHWSMMNCRSFAAVRVDRAAAGQTSEQRIALFIAVCQAVQRAHQKGIIHRNIKPSNILVTSDDGTPVPKVIDFGVAKATTDVSSSRK